MMSFSVCCYVFMIILILAIFNTCRVQSGGVDPAVSKLIPVESQYHQLAAALDTTRHHMPTKGIYLPNDGKEEYIGQTSFLPLFNIIIIIMLICFQLTYLILVTFFYVCQRIC